MPGKKVVYTKESINRETITEEDRPAESDTVSNNASKLEKEKNIQRNSNDTPKKIVISVIFIMIVLLSYIYFSGQSNSTNINVENNVNIINIVHNVYNYFLGTRANQTVIYGVKVVSDGPVDGYLSSIQSNGIALLDSKSDGGITCNFELLATMQRNPKGYTVGVEDGGQGIFLYKGGGLIKGMSEREIVTACNAFVCLAGNITCPEDVSDLGRILAKAGEVNVVLDASAG